MAELESLFRSINHLLEELEQRALGVQDKLSTKEATKDSAPSEERPAEDRPQGVYRWRVENGQGHLRAAPRVAGVTLEDLLCVDQQKQALLRNTCQFRDGLPANNALLWGPRGTGKSSMLQALAGSFASPELRFVELDKRDLGEVRELFELLERGPRSIVLCDDLSFEGSTAETRSLKSVLEGSLNGRPEGSLVYVSSNRRHLMPEFMSDNQASQLDESGELHLAEASEESLSLAERFGLSLAFHSFSQEEYLRIAGHWLQRLGEEQALDAEPLRLAALRWALAKGSRSGRVAYQFACDWAGRVHYEA